MIERPILMSGPMVRATLEDRKTKTRRVVTLGTEFQASDTPGYDFTFRGSRRGGRNRMTWQDYKLADLLKLCPHGQPGDRLYVREAFFDHGPFDPAHPELTKLDERIEYREDEWDRAGGDAGGGWKPSIHMPRWASRLSLEITDVRVERLQAITDEDAIAEGVEAESIYAGDDTWGDDHLNVPETAIAPFRRLWDSLNAKRGYGWDVNPWVWVLSYRRVP